MVVPRRALMKAERIGSHLRLLRPLRGRLRRRAVTPRCYSPSLPGRPGRRNSLGLRRGPLTAGQVVVEQPIADIALVEEVRAELVAEVFCQQGREKQGG